MVLPVTGPFVHYPSEPFADCYQRGYRQKMPIDRPLEYRFYRFYGTTKTDSWFTDGGYSPGYPTKEADFSLSSQPKFANLRDAAYNRAYERLRAQVLDTAGWAENIAQINQSRKMVVESAEAISRVVQSLRRGRFDDALRVMVRVHEHRRRKWRKVMPEGVSVSKKVAENFLAFEYGIKPMISDVQDSLKILLADPPEKMARGRSSERIQKLVRGGGSFGSNPKYSYASNELIDGWVTLTCRSAFRVTSPNLLLANQLGLIDLALPWKLIPFSFIVDWFINVEQVISSMTDWYGVELLNPHVTEFVRGYQKQYYFQTAVYANGTSEGFVTHRDKEHVEMTRTMGLPGPSLIVKPFKGLSLERGAQALALVRTVLMS